MLGHTSYEFYHSLDTDHMTKMHRILLSKGQVISAQYRFLACGGGYVWLQTQASTIYSRSNQPQCIICINSVLSNVIEDSVTFSLDQTRLQTPDTHPENSQHLLTQTEENQKKLDELAPVPEDTITPLDLAGPTDAKAFHFTRRIPENHQATLSPEEFCSPALCKLLSPIFDGPESRRSSTDSKPLSKTQERAKEDAVAPGGTVPKPGSCETSSMNIKEPENNLMAIGSKTLQTETNQEPMELDLEMLAPYISMDEDFQLSSFECAEDKDRQVCADVHPDSDGQNATATDSEGLSATASEPRSTDPSSNRPRSSSFHRVRPQRRGDTPHPKGTSAALPCSSSATDLSKTPAPAPSGHLIAFGGPAFTVAVKNVLLALFQPHATDAEIQISQTASTEGQETTFATATEGLEPSDLLEAAGLVSDAKCSPSKQRTQGDWEVSKNQEELSPQVPDLCNLKRKHSLLNGSFQDSDLDVASVADIVQVTAKRLKRLENQKAAGVEETQPSVTPMTLIMQLLGKEVPGPPEPTRYDCEVNAPLPDRHRLLQGPELLKALDQSS
ncbi:endothelial PAS domain-containing protein 1-like [Stegostoma tigrinum]|uniref:endothelial PAS domain-containing protein 1-like n=1 Tax=Stegostoma tigrinum TaxID=3053191 RepID=UPI0028706CAA|nr:endothelial PAS domain-containing protein 1-like [Stegostoma tigrinum]